ncbi:SGNH/GDSL hydrolase family protein [Sinomicrobium soli]|uniref:SGNH/GDSL hydrolase family protein n=1 Tax=Sinomicrobium sp. N-1-3-6 TaxID=2219864 RepID=UPI000DCE3163|nr:SGNH/GDSL hydrolase family protein [Sinomicrobium sp. N-1-3-6]RAV28420.1 hydrolase [Sinomicrobium sp. N-1-3-6]
MLKYILIFFFTLGTLGIYAQEHEEIRYVDISRFELLGKSDIADAVNFYRIDEALTAGFSERLKALSKNTAGFNVVFKTDASFITVKWELDRYKVLSNMTPIAVDGLDLYGWNDGKWQYVSSARPSGEENTWTFIKNMSGEMRHYRIYFPLYTGVKKMEIGIDPESTILPADGSLLPKRKIAIYGSSITQGASASRPGMAFTSVLGRKLNADIYNLGFSGSGKMEMEMAEALTGITPDLFVLDCVPNPSVEQIRTRTVPFVKTLRKAHPDIPVLMVESVFREHAHWDREWEKTVSGQNAAFRKAYLDMKEGGMDKLYYIGSEGLIGNDHEATIDGTHFTDVGHMRMADRLYPLIVEILPEDE